MKSLDIIVRTRYKSNVSKFPRFILVSKKKLIDGCIDSLINATNQCKNSIKIAILDHHKFSRVSTQSSRYFKNFKTLYKNYF